MHEIDSLGDLSALRSTGGPQSARPYVNPFIMPKGSDRFEYREEENRRQKEQLASVRKMTLIQRTDRLAPKVPSLVSKATLKIREPNSGRDGVSPRSTEVKPVPPECPNTSKNMRMTEFVAQKREIFLVQLMIERKNKEINRLEQDIKAEENNFTETEKNIQEMSNQYKRASAQLEGALTAARKACEKATKKRVELQKEYKCSLQSASIIRSEISKNQDTLEAYRDYFAFLKSVTPDGHKVEDFYASPKVLLTEFDEMEQENLFLISQYQNLENEIDKGVNRESAKLSATDAELQTIERKLGAVPDIQDVPDSLTPGDLAAAASLDAELKNVTDLVYNTYVSCFGLGGNVSAMAMLERLEMGLEDLYVKIQYVHPAFADKKQKKKDAERQENQRREQAERNLAEQRLKVEQALERAKMPIKKRTGRPMVRRVLPINSNRKDPEQCHAEMLEAERIEKLLYGEEF